MMYTRAQRLAVLGVVLSTCGGVWLAASARQDPGQAPQAPAGQSGLHAGVNLVRVDVSVVDGSHQPVRDLNEGDFTIVEDGVPQKVQAFSRVDAPDGTATSGPAWQKTTSPDVATNDLSNHRLIVILLDDAMAIGDPTTLKNTKHIAHEIIGKLGPADLASVVFTRDSRNVQDFTADQAKLNAAADSFTAGFVFTVPRQLATAGPGEAPTGTKPPYPDEYYFRSSAATITNVSEFLAAVPDERKILVYIGIGLPDELDALGSAGLGESNDNEKHELMVSLHDEMQRALERAARANVAIYTFDPAGLDGLNNFCTRPMGNQNPCLSANPSPPPSTAYADYLRALAADTGGRAAIDTNQFDTGVTQMFADNATYYLLGYESTNTKTTGGLRRIEVKVDRPGVDVRSRQGYYGPSQSADDTGVSSETNAISGLLPDPTTPMEVDAMPFEKPDGTGSEIALVLGLKETAPTAHATESIDLLTSAFTPEGVAAGSQTQTAEVTLRPLEAGETDNEARYEVLASIDAKPGRYSLRLAAHNATRDQSGSVFADVTVPNFLAAPLSLSGVAVSASSRPVSAPDGFLSPTMPIVPTTERMFAITDSATALFRVYEGGKGAVAPVALKTTILDEHDAPAAAHDESIDPTRFGTGRSADVRFELPLADLKPGIYRVRFEATLGKTVEHRDVVFGVK